MNKNNKKVFHMTSGAPFLLDTMFINKQNGSYVIKIAFSPTSDNASLSHDKYNRYYSDGETYILVIALFSDTSASTGRINILAYYRDAEEATLIETETNIETFNAMPLMDIMGDILDNCNNSEYDIVDCDVKLKKLPSDPKH